MSDVVVEIATEATPELVDAMARLVPQLSSSSPAPTAHELHELVTSPACDLLVARLDGLRHLEDAIGERRLAVVDVRDDREVADEARRRGHEALGAARDAETNARRGGLLA